MRIKQRQVLPGIDKAVSQATKVYVAETCAANDILVATGLKNGFLSVVKADANDIAKCRGPFFVADYAATLGDYVAGALPWKLVTGVNTATYANGDAVYLDAATTGGVVLPIPGATGHGAVFSAVVKVGSVVRTHASTGAYLLEPGIANGAPLTGRTTLNGTGSEVTFGATADSNKLIGAPAIATGALTALVAADGAGSKLVLTHASSTAVCAYTIFA